ncbi:rhodanese-like domain-containing protein [Weeksellaceae bacterium TAE3-ERU29]|nr:rhodanese-like domain-containing protein [Weeksellaceae bacterium TAE3-ERU29]
MLIPNLFRYLFFRKIIKTTTMDAIRDKNATLIDLRNQDELDEYGFIENAVHIPLPELPNKLEDIENYNKPIVLFCKAGGRAERAKEFLEAHGFTDVYNAGGYEDVKSVLES